MFASRNQFEGGHIEEIHQSSNSGLSRPESTSQKAAAMQEKGMVELSTYFNNVAEFGKYNDLNSLDFGAFNGKNNDEHFIRGLLTNLEFLALKWQLIDPTKFNYRHDERNLQDGQLPSQTTIQNFFHLSTFKLAQTRVYMAAVNGEQVLIEKEFALAAAKLIQQFQKVLYFIKSVLEPVFCPSELDEFSNDSSSEKRRESGIF